MNLYFLKYLFLTRWKFKYPKKNKYLLVDGDYNPFNKYIKNTNFTILYRRGEEINIPILIKCIAKMKFTALDYCSEYIKYVAPKLILTAYDYHTIFYKLSKKTGIKTLMIQKGKRSINDSIIKHKNKFFLKKSKYDNFVDYILVYNESVKKFYQNKINGKYFVIGSFENNFTKLNKKYQKNEVLFISNFNILANGQMSHKNENEDKIAKIIMELSLKNNLKFNVLARNRKNKFIKQKEFIFYKNILGPNFKFLANDKKDGYDSLNKYKYIFSSYSTMCIEALVKGSRCGFIFCKSKTNPVYGLWFASFEKFKLNGPFWTTSEKINSINIEKIFDFVTKTSEKKWKKIVLNYSNRLMKYDYENKVFKSILKKELL